MLIKLKAVLATVNPRQSLIQLVFEMVEEGLHLRVSVFQFEISNGNLIYV